MPSTTDVVAPQERQALSDKQIITGWVGTPALTATLKGFTDGTVKHSTTLSKAARPPVDAAVTQRGTRSSGGRNARLGKCNESGAPPHFTRKTQPVDVPWRAHLWAAKGGRHELDVWRRRLRDTWPTIP